MAAYKPKRSEIAGFELIGYRQESGKIRLGSESNIIEIAVFPPEVEVCGCVYTLEFVKLNADETTGKLHNNIEWGVYV